MYNNLIDNNNLIMLKGNHASLVSNRINNGLDSKFEEK